jgi:DNA-binding MarR family transcriptional regulator
MAKKDKAKKKDGKKPKQAANPKDIAFEVAQVARHFRTLTSRALSDLGLYGGQEGVMLALGERDGLPAGAIAEALGVKAPTITRTISRMEAQGFVTRRGGDDGRLTTVWLSGNGRAALSTIQSASAGVYETAFKDMDDKQMRRLLEALQTLDENLSSALSSEP